jgi:hypothetical protein
MKISTVARCGGTSQLLRRQRQEDHEFEASSGKSEFYYLAS